MLINEVEKVLLKFGVVDYGIAPARVYEELRHILEKRGNIPYVKKNIESRINPFIYLPEAKSVIVCLFPYLPDDGTQNSKAKFARGGSYRDIYRVSLFDMSEEIKSIFAEEPYRLDFLYRVFIDNGGLLERHMAYLAGLGRFGKNNMLYNKKLGCRFFIGLILCNAELPVSKPLEGDLCGDCDICLKACPTNALGEGFVLDYSVCLSFITQSKKLEDFQISLLEVSQYEKGCDLCTDCCPFNSGF